MYYQDNLALCFPVTIRARDSFVELIEASSNAPKDVATLKSLMGKRVQDYLGNTYKIFEDKSILPFLNYA